MLLSNLVVFDKTKTIPCKTVARRFRMIVYSFRGTIEPFINMRGFILGMLLNRAKLPFVDTVVEPKLKSLTQTHNITVGSCLFGF